MKSTIRKCRLQIAVLLVALLSVLTIPATSPVMHAQESVEGCAQQIPQWVRDRQQFETTYVYGSATTTARVPQWVIDRQQYETSYIYVMAVAAAPQIPQWARDREQHETSYVYAPLESALSARVSLC